LMNDVAWLILMYWELVTFRETLSLGEWEEIWVQEIYYGSQYRRCGTQILALLLKMLLHRWR
jgi:hypothetical protein